MEKVEANTINSLEELDSYLKNSDNARNRLYISEVPQICRDEPCMLGIDEAGRGPVLGPMVYGIAFCPLSKSEKLLELKCVDSKALNEGKRDSIFSEILKSSDDIGYAVEVISPNTICNSMYSRNKISLNQVSMDSAIGLIRQAITMGVNIAEIYVDTVGLPEKYQAYLSKLFPAYKITVAKKADSTYPIVSAASICAKVTRDHALQVWVFQEGIDLIMEDFGSGYPGDPVTKKFLQTQMDPIFGFPQLVRFSWSTSEKILEEQGFHVEWEDIEDPDNPSTQNKSIASFFQTYAATDGAQKMKSLKNKHKFFSDRCLKNCTEF